MFDIGESLVGSYLRHVEGCSVIAYNSRLPNSGEVDVVGLKFAPSPEVWMCEVGMHLEGLLYGNGVDDTVRKLEQKLARARAFAKSTFPGASAHFQVWAMRAPVGKLTAELRRMAATAKDASVDLSFVLNDDFTARVQALVEKARSDVSATSEPAYRMLQIVTHLRGELRV